jgi:hypothetical protein
VDLVPALRSHGVDAEAIVGDLMDACQQRGEARIPDPAKDAIRAVAAVLNIAWIADALASPARLICPRSTYCPRAERCDGGASRAREITDIRQEIVEKARRR